MSSKKEQSLSRAEATNNRSRTNCRLPPVYRSVCHGSARDVHADDHHQSRLLENSIVFANSSFRQPTGYKRVEFVEGNCQIPQTEVVSSSGGGSVALI